MTPGICTNCHRMHPTDGPLCQRCVSAGVVPPLMVPANETPEEPPVKPLGEWTMQELSGEVRA